jgi:predicted RNase H-like HicB family nuclease
MLESSRIVPSQFLQNFRTRFADDTVISYLDNILIILMILPGISILDPGWYVAYCAEVPSANGQGKTREECLANLRQAIALILEHRRDQSLRALPADARQELVVVG